MTESEEINGEERDERGCKGEGGRVMRGYEGKDEKTTRARYRKELLKSTHDNFVFKGGKWKEQTQTQKQRGHRQ